MQEWNTDSVSVSNDHSMEAISSLLQDLTLLQGVVTPERLIRHFLLNQTRLTATLHISLNYNSIKKKCQIAKAKREFSSGYLNYTLRIGAQTGDIEFN